MAVLSRPAARHVRRPGEAIAIIDLGEDGASLSPERTVPSRRSRRALAAFAGVAIGVVVSAWPLASVSRSPATATPQSADAAPRASAAAATGAVHVLSLPPGITDADLSVMPDRYVNEPPPASYRLVVTVRGIPALASVDPPAAITWTEGGLSYRLTTHARTVTQLLDIASSLR